VRELENVIEGAVVVRRGNTVTGDHLPEAVGASPGDRICIPGSTLAEIERHAIATTLKAGRGCTARTAEGLGVSLRKVQYKLQEYGIVLERTTRAKRPRLS
jgi:two-component system response regulator HydG